MPEKRIDDGGENNLARKPENFYRNSYMGVLGCVEPPEMRVSTLAGKEMGSIENKLSTRPLFCAVVILSIFIAGSLFTGAPLVNAQAEDAPTTDERLEDIEELLKELIDSQDDLQFDMDNIHESYITREIFDIKISNLKDTNTLQNALLIAIFICVFAPYASPRVSSWRNKDTEDTQPV